MTEAPIRFRADRATYFRSHTRLAAIAMGGAMLVLWLMGDPNIWTGAVAGLGAIALRGFYMRSEELGAIWEIRGNILTGPSETRVPLSSIETLRPWGSFVQVITRDGHKHLIKYQADADATISAIRRAMTGSVHTEDRA